MTEKEEWFKEQCKQKGLSTEEITVFGGDYATNRDGDFLYGIQLKEGSYEMGYVSAADLIEDGSFYAEWLYFLLVAMEPDRYEDQDLYGSRWHIDKLAICPCFHEAICRNRELPESYRHELRSQPVRGIFIPARQDAYNQVMYSGGGTVWTFPGVGRFGTDRLARLERGGKDSCCRLGVQL